MFFSLNLSPLVAGLLAAALLLTVGYLLWQWHRTRRLTRFAADEPNRTYLSDNDLPPVSIIVDATNETDQLPRFLPLVLHQDYPCFEVVVVAGGSAESTRDLLSEMKAHFPNLHITFAPDNTRSLSRKKLALMIGIKAAQYDVVLTTCANCRPTSDRWLRLIARNFVRGIDVVLGYSHYRYRHDRRSGRLWRVFGSVTTDVQWLTAAIAGHPYRGTSDNLAYRKQRFFEQHGFARTMHLRWGEDDVFLQQIANGGNTRVEISPDSQLNVYYENMPHAHRLRKMRRDFTSKLVSRGSFVAQGLSSWAWWLRLAALASAVALDWRNGAVWVAAVAVWLLSWVGVTVALRCQCKVLQAPPLLLSVPVLTLLRPLSTLRYRLREMKLVDSNYTNHGSV